MWSREITDHCLRKTDSMPDCITASFCPDRTWRITVQAGLHIHSAEPVPAAIRPSAKRFLMGMYAAVRLPGTVTAAAGIEYKGGPGELPYSPGPFLHFYVFLILAQFSNGSLNTMVYSFSLSFVTGASNSWIRRWACSFAVVSSSLSAAFFSASSLAACSAVTVSSLF